MAIKFNDLKNKLDNDPLTQEEINTIQSVEDWIDKEIQVNFGKTYYDAWIDRAIVSFNYNPVTRKPIDVKDPRRQAMRKELENRYIKAGWKITWPDEIDNTHVKFSGK
jgi:hypothetical protein